MKELERHSSRLAALAHPLRLAILRHIVQGDPEGTPAGELQRLLGVPASTLSHHLATLAGADLVRVQREGTVLRHRADFEVLRSLTAFIWEDCCGRGSRHSEPAQACCPPPPAVPEANLPVEEAQPSLPRRTRPRTWRPDLD